METDRIKWNENFSKRDKLLPQESFFVENFCFTKNETVLDLASGDGRNAIYFAKKGARVTAVDISDVGLKKLTQYAEKNKVHVDTLNLDLELIEDIAQIGKFDTVIISFFKPSYELWNRISDVLNQNGKVIFCTFNLVQNKENGFPKKYCLSHKEFYDLNPSLICEKYESYEKEGKNLDGYIFKLR